MESSNNVISISLLDESNEYHISQLKNLFYEYSLAQEKEGILLNETQDFVNEINELPGKYSNSNNGFIYLAYLNNVIIGTVALRYFKLDEACVKDKNILEYHNNLKLGEIKRLFVNSIGRGKSIGKDLTLKLVSKAKEMGYQKLFLDSCERLKAANKIYPSLGFKSTFQYCFNPYPDAVFYEMDL